MLRVFIDSTADDVLVAENGYLDTWITNYQAWEDDHHSNDDIQLREADPSIADRPDHYHADWRFAWSESKAELVANLEGHVDAYTNWYRFLYHECTHDEDNSAHCDWDDVIEGGGVPSGIPNPEITA